MTDAAPRPRRPNSRQRLRAWREDVAEAARSLWHAPGYALPAILSVALGVGAATIVCAVFSAVVLRPLPFAHEEQLAVVFDDLGSADTEHAPISAVELAEYRQATTSMAALAAQTVSEATLTGLGLPRHINVAQATTNLFDTIQLAPELGHFFSDRDQAASAGAAVISHEFWISAFGGAPPIGRTFVLEGVPRTVVGVMRRGDSLQGADVVVPMRLTTEQATRRGFRILFAVARLRGHAKLGAAQQELDAIASNARPLANGRHVRVRMQPLREQLLGANRPMVQFILAAVCVFLLLSCTNVASLMLTRASVRNHELALRAALGCSAVRLARCSLLEAFLLVAAGGGAGLAFAAMALPVVATKFADMFANSPPQIDGHVVALFAVVCLVTTLGIGLAPALRVSRTRSMAALRQGGRSSLSRRSRRVQELFVCLQVAATVVLLVSAGSLMRSLHALTKIAPGFDASAVVTGRVSLPATRYGDDERMRQLIARALEALRRGPSTEAAATSLLPLSDSNAINLTVEGQLAAVDRRFVEERHVTPDYFRVLRTPLVEGRMLAASDDERAPRVAVVNRAFVDALLGRTDAVGRRFDDGTKDAAGAPRWTTIVGVVGDTRDFGLDAPVRPTFFVPFAQAPIADVSFVVRDRDRDAAGLLRDLPRQMAEVDGELPVYEVMTLRERLASSYRSRVVVADLLLAFAIASMLLAAVGLFGVTSYSVSQRSQELAIRRAVGASRPRIVGMVAGETSVVIGIGIASGAVGALLLGQLMASLLFGVAPSDLFSVGAAVAIAFSISLAAALPAALRASAVAPVELLKGG